MSARSDRASPSLARPISILDVSLGDPLEKAARVRCAVGAKICLDQRRLKVFPAGRDENGLLERGFGFVEMFTVVEIDVFFFKAGATADIDFFALFHIVSMCSAGALAGFYDYA